MGSVERSAFYFRVFGMCGVGGLCYGFLFFLGFVFFFLFWWVILRWFRDVVGFAAFYVCWLFCVGFGVSSVGFISGFTGVVRF